MKTYTKFINENKEEKEKALKKDELKYLSKRERTKLNDSQRKTLVYKRKEKGSWNDEDLTESLTDKMVGKSKDEILNNLNYDLNTTFKPSKAIGGSWLQGEYNTTYNTLVKLFGNPIINNDLESNYEWVLVDNNGHKVRIYDRNPEFDFSEYRDKDYSWHIGGRDKQVANNLIGYIINNTM